MQRWIIKIGCLLLWHGDGMAQGKAGMPAEMARKMEELNARAEALYEKGEYDAAFESARESLTICERYLGSKHPDVARPLNHLAVLYKAKGEYERALPLLERALAISEKALGPDHPSVAESLQHLAVLHDKKANYDRALPLNERALAIRQQALGPTHPDVAESLNHLAVLHYEQGNYDRALSLFERALAIREKALGPTHPDVAESLNDLADLYHDKWDYERALPLYQRALAIREEALGPNHPDVGRSLHSLAWLYQAKGDYDKALRLFERALAIRESVLGPSHPDVAASLAGLAWLYLAQSDLSQALPLLERALAIAEKTMGPVHPRVAMILAGLTMIYSVKGDYDQALLLDERALAIAEKTLGPVHRLVGSFCHNLATLYQAKGDYDQALPLFQRGLALLEKARGPEHPEVANSLQNLANLYREKGSYDQALPLCERALVIHEKALGPEHPRVAGTLHYLALVYQAKGDYDQALALYQRALVIVEKTLGPANDFLAFMLDQLAKLQWTRGAIAEAIHHARRAEEIHETHLRLMLADDSERAKRMLMTKLADDMDRYVTMALQTSRSDAMLLMLTKILRYKGRVLGSMTATFAAVRRHPDAGVRALWEEYRSNRTQYATQLVRGPERIAPEPHRKNLDTLEKRAVELERLLGDRSREFHSEQAPITVEAVQAALLRDAALVEWIRYRRFDPRATREVNKSKPLRYAACVLLAAGLPRCLDLGEATDIDADIKALRNALARNLATLPNIARRLEAKIMAPVRAHLADISRVYLSPDGPLHLIPFAALRDEHGRYLVERYTFTYLTTGRELLQRGTTERASSPVLITANPSHGEPGPGQHQAFSFSPLTNARYEAEAVAAMFREPLVLMGPDASEARVKQAHSPLIWHHAGHASFRPLSCAADVESPDDPRLQSVLAMAGANICQDGADDGLLTAVEVAGLDLGGTRLVVLSACETGVGATSLRETSGRETGAADGLYGLRRALVIAGSETQMLSLWSVEDRPTRHLIEAYYRNLLEQGMGRSEALRQVQLAWLKGGGVHASPYYWAAFVVSGNDSPLDAGSLSTVPRVQRSPRGCACDAGTTSSDIGQGWGIALLLGLVVIMGRCGCKVGLSIKRFRRSRQSSHLAASLFFALKDIDI